MLGEKTKRLQELVKAGFRVPQFVGIETGEIEADSQKLAEDVLAQLNAKLFAVRSSALAEDAAKASMAGQFLTRLAVPRNDLAQAIDEVLHDALAKLGGLQEFSLLVQEFVEADYSGVTFTRNPIGDRELVVEYHRGRGDKLVGGAVRPEREIFYRTQTDISSDLPDIETARETFLKIEELFSFPQDIEWCIRGKEWFILQSRPITSLTQESVDQLERLEQVLPKGRYYFAKTEVCDVAPRPSAPTLELLKAMYAAGGPVQMAYAAHGIEYVDTNFLKVIEGELFVDKDKELHSLLPAYSYLHAADYQPRPVRVVGFLTSLKNTKRLRAIDGDLVAQSKELKERLATPFSRVSEKVARQAFLEEYELIFNINLCAQRAVETLKQSLAPGQTLAQALACFPKDLEPSWEAPTGLRGNTFELSDESEFIAVVGQPRTGSGLENLPTVELKTAQSYLRLREYGRWLALRHINRIRELLPTVSVSDKSVPSLPATITDRPLPPTSGAPLGVSAGQATGKLVLKPEEGGILVVSELTPELAHHAGILEGVIADHGGLLSHFAIIARELGLPVIVNYPIGELKIGSVVAMDGSTGEVIVKSRP